MWKQCRSGGCKLCSARHNTMLHVETKSTAAVQAENDTLQPESVNLASQNISNSTQVLLSTVLVDVFDKNHTTQVARALLDAGSQSSFITSEFCNQLRLPDPPVTSRYAVSIKQNQRLRVWSWLK